jgi:hypothetical protein
VQGTSRKFAVSIFSDHVPELLLSICASRVVVGPASSGFNYLNI